MRKNIELYLSTFAVLISFVAAGFSGWQLKDAREHNRLSVKPIINITPYLEAEGGRSGVYISNQGLGPALIKSMNVTVDGETFGGQAQNVWPDILSRAGTEPLCYKHGWQIQGSVLKVGEEEAILAPTEADLPYCNALAMIFQLQKDITIKINYESIYKESFVAIGSTKMNINFPL